MKLTGPTVWLFEVLTLKLARQFLIVVRRCGDQSQGDSMQARAALTEETLSRITARQRTMLKLQFGSLPLSGEELGWVLPEGRVEAAIVRPRTLDEVARLIGVTRQRIRQVNTRSLAKLGFSENAKR